MMKKDCLTIVSLLVVLQACNFDDDPLPVEQLVVEAFLYAHEPVDDIHIFTSIPITTDTAIFPPISNAQVRLIRDEVIYDLIPSAEAGYYHYPDTDFDVKEGDEFLLEIYYDNRAITATTVVPPAPLNVKINHDTIEIPPLVPGVIAELAEIQLNITWENPGEDLHFAVIENIEPLDELELIIPQQFQPVREAFLIIAEPTLDTLQNFNVSSLIYLGTHVAKVYRVNQEYADLYSSRAQDSRDLNEPPTNVVNGLGIFSAFSSEQDVFEVRRR